MKNLKTAIGVLATVLLLTGLLFTPPAYSADGDALARSAYETGDVDTGVRYLLQQNVPISVIIKNAVHNGVSQKRLVSALLGTGLEKKETTMQMVVSDQYIKSKTLKALTDNGIGADKILAWMVQQKADIELIVDAADFMLKQGDSKMDVMQTLYAANADRETTVEVVRRLNISPAAVAGTRQAAEGKVGDDLLSEETAGFSRWLAAVLSGGPWDSRGDTTSSSTIGIQGTRTIISPTTP